MPLEETGEDGEDWRSLEKGREDWSSLEKTGEAGEVQKCLIILEKPVETGAALIVLVQPGEDWIRL